MATTEEVVLTQDGYEQMKKKLEDYKRILHDDLPKKLKLAKEHGAELRENKEYFDIQREQEFYESEVRRLEELLENAKVIADKDISTKRIGIGSKVTLQDLKSKKTAQYELVSPAEADPESNKISTESPVGRALLSQRKGAEVQVQTPAGTLRYKVIEIERA